jgi:hypothetical protein
MRMTAGGSWFALWTALLFAASHAQAQVAEGDDDAWQGWGSSGLVLGGKIGGGLGKPFNELGASYVLELELGYQLPLGSTLGRTFELAAVGSYTAPRTEGNGAELDPRLPGSEPFHYEVDQQIAGVGMLLRYRIPFARDMAALVLGAGARLHLMRTRVSGDVDGESFGGNEETSSAIGPLFAVSGELQLGPGAALLELQLSHAAVDGYVLRDTNVAALALLVGYRFMPMPRATRPAEPEPAQPPARAAPEPEPAATPTPSPAPDAVQDGAQAMPATPAPAAAEPGPSPAEALPLAGAAAPPAAEGASGTIRGQIRGFDGAPVPATASVYPLGTKASTDAEGKFELSVPPGQYTVRVRAFGYRSQNRRVAVSADGITVLNIELRKK